jgi:nucleotide-binding universal stress UspA family protein
MLVDYKKIMVTLDGSEFASQAVPHAYTLAKKLGAELILFRVVRDASKTTGPLDADALEDADLTTIDRKQQESVSEAHRALQQQIDSIGDQSVKTTPVVEIGLPPDRIVDYARTNQVDLIVMSSHGRTGLQRLVHGSVAESVLRMAPCPTFVLRSALM